MATIVKLWDNGDELTLVTSGSGVSISSDQNLTGSTRQKTLRIQTTDGGLYQDIVINQGIQSAVQDGYWVHKDTNAVTYFGLEDSSIEGGVMGYPSWMPNCSEVKLPAGVTGFKTYNWVFEELGGLVIPYTGFVHSKETFLTGNSVLIGVDLSNTSISSISDYAFYECSSLTSINIPEGVTSLGEGCFQGCLSLTSITLPESVTSIDNFCFSYCQALTSITLPEGVTSLGEGCFYYCQDLTLATVLPATPPSLGYGAFNNVHPSFNIKVRSPYVDTYKTATNWTEYASIISSI